MRYFDPMKETPEGQLLSLIKQIESVITKNKNYSQVECSSCKGKDGSYECPKCGVKKYDQETSVNNIRPMFMEISGKTEIRAAGYQGNQVIPYMEDGPSRKPISEVFKMPSVAQTGYDAKSSSLHMHYNDGGDSDYRDKVEESLAMIRKNADAGQLGIIEEIAGKIERLYARL